MINLSIGLPSADFFRLDRALGKIEKSVADAVHFDIMDGNFVPAITYGPKVLADLRPHSGKFFDAHLMVADPLAQVAAFALAGADMITVHAEAPSAAQALSAAKKAGVKAGVAIMAKTPLAQALPFLDGADCVLVMAAELGVSGAGFDDKALPKIALLRAAMPGMHILVDGGMNFETARLARLAGADGIVSGSFVFSRENFASAARQLAFCGKARAAK